MRIKNVTILNEACWKGYEQKGMKKKGNKNIPNCVPKNENINEEEMSDEMTDRYMFFSNLEQIHRETGKLLELDKDKVNELLTNGHDWAQDHIATSKEAIDQVFDFMMNEFNGAGHEQDSAPTNMNVGFTNENFFALVDEIIKEETGTGIIDDLLISSDRLCEGKITAAKLEKMVNEALTEYYSMTEETLNEAEYKGRKVSLGKISRGDSKKYKVHVKNAKGNVVKVEFGDPNMEIKRDNPERRKNFRARHRCSNPGPRWKARYWACKTWSNKPVSKMVGENK
jgi:hypothetical protein